MHFRDSASFCLRTYFFFPKSEAAWISFSPLPLAFGPLSFGAASNGFPASKFFGLSPLNGVQHQHKDGAPQWSQPPCKWQAATEKAISVCPSLSVHMDVVSLVQHS